MRRFELRLHQALESWEQQVIETILKSPAVHVDETSLWLSYNANFHY
jgi:hypothetical protein